MSLIGMPDNKTAQRVISFNYILKDSAGKLLDQSGTEPLVFLEGSSQILPNLESQIVGMLIGTKKTIKLKAVEAYGDLDPEMMFEVPRKELEHLPLELGSMLQMNMGEQTQVVRIANVSEDSVTLDGNHPLAGVDLEFEIEMIDTRAATADEVTHGHAHGRGGHQH